jgi:hypothetical protein
MNMSDYFNLVNNSTFIGNMNQGNVIDPYRYRQDQKQELFAKNAKIEYNSSNKVFKDLDYSV